MAGEMIVLHRNDTWRWKKIVFTETTCKGVKINTLSAHDK